MKRGKKLKKKKSKTQEVEFKLKLIKLNKKFLLL
jgi:hypothetical protein